MNKFTPEKRSKIMSAIRSRDTLPEGFEGQDRVPHILEKGSDKVAYDILKQLADGPRRPAELRAALGIASANFFTARYLTPLAKSGYIAVAGGEKNRYLPGQQFRGREADAERPNRFWTRGRMRRRAKPGGEVAGGDGKADRRGPRGA